MSEDQRSDYRQVAVFNRLEEAEVARGMLEADGIPAALLDAQMAALGLGPAVGGVRLLVPAWDAERAMELLAPPGPEALEGLLATFTPRPGSLPTVTPPPAAPAARDGRSPALPAAGPIELRVAFWVALALAAAVIAALR